MRKNPVPVLMYHSIGVKNRKWKWNYLTTPYKDFERELLYLKNKGYNTINLEELYNYVSNNKSIPAKSVVLTFDDGYVDNYIFAYPLLKKYGFKGTIFVNPEFVDPRKIIRDRYDQDKNVVSKDTTGFLSWEEMKIMEKDNVIDIQSHAMTHTWYPISDNIIDYRKENDDYWWMTWNNFPEKKPFLQIEDESLVNLGEPIYENKKSLMAKRFFPNNQLSEHLIKFVKKNGGKEFFNSNDWKSTLDSEKDKVLSYSKFKKGSYESEEEKLLRIKTELKDSKEIIENKLNKKVNFLCWPGGSGTKEGQLIAEEIGYKMTTAARDIKPSLRKKIKNNGEIYNNRIGRTSSILFEKTEKGVYRVIYSGGFGLGLKIKVFNSTGLKRKFFASVVIIFGKIINLYKN